MTTLSPDADQFRVHRYAPSVRLIPKGADETAAIDMTQALLELRILKDFDTQAFPYVRMEVGVSVNEATQIQDVWREARLFVTLTHRYIRDAGSDQEEYDTLEDYLKDAEFQIMVLDGAPPNVPAEQEAGVTSDAPSVRFVMELAPVIALSVNKRVNNGVYHEATLGEVVGALTVRNKPAARPYKFFMAATDNPRRYESIALPPSNYVQSVRYLDKVHGLYKGRLAVFLDIDAGFILSSTKVVQLSEQAPTRVMLEAVGGERAGMAPTQGSAYDEKTRAFRLRTSQRIDAEIAGPVRKETVGERIKLVRATFAERSGSDCKGLTPDTKPLDAVEKARVRWQTYDNDLTADRLKVEARESYAPATVSFESPDLAAFSPVLPWVLVSDEERLKDLEGHWRLQAVEIVLGKQPRSDETCKVHVMARLVPSAATP